MTVKDSQICCRGGALYDAAVASGPYSHFYAYGQVPQWTTRQLETGDLFHCDMYGAAVEGYRYDPSRTVICGGKPTKDQEEVVEGAIAAIEAGVAAIRPGMRASELYTIVHSVLEERGVEIGDPLHGHSYGLGWESPWLIPSEDAVIGAGMAIAIETMAGREGVGCAKFEENVLVSEDKVELLTTTPKRPWL
ncbi:M24 family metallopeptidase [Streptomyces sp. NPDC047061]|uniref:M24 family metallopeptidase n=1 Tax=Streptomyces sp. NPDC047061 TaxID=3154605 RepID=UPI0033D4AE6F